MMLQPISLGCSSSVSTKYILIGLWGLTWDVHSWAGVLHSLRSSEVAENPGSDPAACGSRLYTLNLWLQDSVPAHLLLPGIGLGGQLDCTSRLWDFRRILTLILTLTWGIGCRLPWLTVGKDAVEPRNLGK